MYTRLISKSNVDKMFTKDKTYFIIDFVSQDEFVIADDENRIHFMTEKEADKNFIRC